MSYKFIDLFAGIGGFHLAFHQLGAECVFSSEWDESARKTYEHNFKYFFDYAVKQSLGFNTGPQEGQDSHGARGIKLSSIEWLMINKLFKFWWKRKDVHGIFTLVHKKTIEGRNLVNA